MNICICICMQMYVPVCVPCPWKLIFLCACVRVWSLHDSECHNHTQKQLGILTGNHSSRSCAFLRHSHKESLDWTLIKEVKEEAPRPSCLPSESLHRASREASLKDEWEPLLLQNSSDGTGWGWILLVIGGQMSGWLTFSHNRLVTVITMNAEQHTDWPTELVWN